MQRRVLTMAEMKHSGPNGLLVLDKPTGLTSRDAVDRAQRWFPRGTKVGHTGTLDPLATGVLVLCLGPATRLAEYVQLMPKTYRSTFLLGHRSDTDDADGTVTPVSVAAPPTLTEVTAALAGFVGEIDQVPPSFSAAKVTGQRAYALARKGADVDLKPRRITVHGIDALSYAWPRLDVEVRCGKGTYIRSLARDLGQRLGCGGLVEVLRRTKVGPFEADAAVSLDADAVTARTGLRPVGEAVAALPRVQLPAEAVTRLRRGQAILWAPLPNGDEAAAFGPEGTLVAVVRLDHRHRLLRPDKVLAS
jgi:tRNA pseudouridine55 synthase